MPIWKAYSIVNFWSFGEAVTTVLPSSLKVWVLSFIGRSQKVILLCMVVIIYVWLFFFFFSSKKKTKKTIELGWNFFPHGTHFIRLIICFDQWKDYLVGNIKMSFMLNFTKDFKDKIQKHLECWCVVIESKKYFHVFFIYLSMFGWKPQCFKTSKLICLSLSLGLIWIQLWADWTL